jgi:serine/threonine protein kinase
MTTCASDLKIDTSCTQEDKFKGKKYFDRYTIHRRISKTIYGCLFLAYDDILKNFVAVKMSRKSACENTYKDHNSYDNPFNEIQIMKYFQLQDEQSNNIVRLIDAFKTCNSLYTVMEYVSGGELFNIISNPTRFRSITYTTKMGWFSDIVSAVSYLHKRNISHMDISLENCLIDSNNVIKLCDFGLAEYCETNNFRPKGKTAYMAPELWNMQDGDLNGDYDTRSSDIFSLGVLLFIVLTGTQPFCKSSKDRHANYLFKFGIKKFLLEVGITLNPGIVHILDGMLSCDLSKRFNIQELQSTLKLHLEMVPDLSVDTLRTLEINLSDDSDADNFKT